jgi:cardiolipin synthase
MADKESRLQWTEGNRITLLHNGGEFFPALCQAIDEAKVEVHLETYIFSTDSTALNVLDHLAAAGQRGVRLRVVIDGFGSNEFVDELSHRLAQMGARYRIYRPEPRGVGNMRFNLRRLRRLHRKTAVIDETIAFVGGINILDDYVDVPNDGPEIQPRFDFAVRLEGPIVDGVSRAQRALWLRMAWRRRDDWALFYKRLRNWAAWRQARVKRRQPVYEPGMRAALLLRDNVLHRQSIENVYLATIGGADKEVLIANAYFFPGRRLRKALVAAARRGVRVRLLLQGHSEYAMQYRACRYMYRKMLDADIEVYEYMASYLHAKVAAIDSCAMVGSSNLDPFSLLLAREANVYVRDDGFAAQLRQALEGEIESNARQVTQASLQRLSWPGRLLDGLAYMKLRIGVALTGKSSEY